MRISIIVLVMVVILSPGEGTGSQIFDIPPVDGIIVDGSGEDWGAGGFRVELVPEPGGAFRPAADFDVRFRLGWNGGGLYVLALVSDDTPDEHEEEKRLWQKDCVELFVAEGVGSGNMYQVVFAPGADGDSGSIRTKLYDFRSEGTDHVAIETKQVSSIHEGGYAIEAFLPWKNLGIDPRIGLELAFQLVANDSDGRGEPVFRTAWYPRIGAHENTGLMHAVRLAGKSSAPVTLRAARRSTIEGCVVTITGAREENGSPYLVTGGTSEHAGTLDDLEGRAGARIVLENPGDDGLHPSLIVAISGKKVGVFESILSMKHILGMYVESLGGRGALGRLGSRYCACRSSTEPVDHPRTVKDDAGSGGDTRFEMTVDADGRWLYQALSSDSPVRRGFDGNEGWIRDKNGIYREDLSGYGVTVWWIDPLGALRIDRYFTELEVVDPGPDKGGDVFVIRGKLPSGRAIRLVFDAESGILTRAGRLYFTDYREVDGVKIPHLVYFDSGGNRTRFLIDEVKHNINLEDGMFDVPDPADAYPEIFGDIDDKRVLPMLKNLPTVHGGMNVPAADGRFLYDLVIESEYTRGLEIGTSNGYSTLWLGLAFRETGGKVITIEYERQAGLEAKENFERAGLDNVIDLRINDAFEEIPAIEGKFDFIFIDAWKPDYIRFLEMIRDRVVPGGAIAAHNVIAQERSMRDFLEAIENDPGLETTYIEVSSEGISLSIVKK